MSQEQGSSEPGRAQVRIDSLGHVVLKVRNLEAAERFYGQVLGIPIQSRSEASRMTFFTLGAHHDFAVLAVGDEAPDARADSVGTHHIAFRVAGGLEGLRAAKTRLEAEGVTVAPVDHGVTRSLYFGDPDGNALELYVDGSEEWRSDPELLFAPVRKLEL
ncbi:MAG: VOC family protein [Myxococcota bacterium]